MYSIYDPLLTLLEFDEHALRELDEQARLDRWKILSPSRFHLMVF
jgi:hypothetical protein